MSLKETIRREKPYRGRRAVSAVLAFAAMLGMSVAAAIPSSAYVASSTGATADTRMHCTTAGTSAGPYTLITAEVLHSRGFEYARVYLYSNGTYYPQTGWVSPSQLRQYPMGKTQTSAVLVVFADRTGSGYTYHWDWAERADGRGYYC